MPDGRVLVALADGPLTESPTWTRIDDDIRVSLITIRTGKQTEQDETETSTATVTINDVDGDLDPANTGSPISDLVGKQIMLQVQNPVTSAWWTRFRGNVNEITFDHEPSQRVTVVQLECVGPFDYLNRVEMIPGLFGDAPPTGSEGVVFYEDGPVQTRLQQLAADASFPSGRCVFFTGNVDVLETKYDPGDAILVGMRDAADAEAPSVANLFEDRLGRVVFHGRFAQLDPEGTEASATPGAWDFTRWKAGDGAAILLDSDRAQIRPLLRESRSRSRIINAALAYPRGIAETAIPNQIYVDSSSVTDYGYRSWSATDLITGAGTTLGNTANQETKLFGKFHVENYKLPRTRVESLTFKSVDPDDPRAEATWALMCGQDIGDGLNLAHGYPGGVGFDEDGFIVGSETTIRILRPDFDMVEVTVNVAPAPTVDVFV